MRAELPGILADFAQRNGGSGCSRRGATEDDRKDRKHPGHRQRFIDERPAALEHLFLLVFGDGGARHYDHRQRWPLMRKRLRKFKPRHSRTHLDIGQQQIDLRLQPILHEGVLCIAAAVDLIALRHENCLAQVKQHRIIIDEQNSRAAGVR